MSKMFVCLGNVSNFDASLEYAKEHSYNVEVATFVMPSFINPNCHEIFKAHHVSQLDTYYPSTRELVEKLHGFKGAISVHGACIDLLIHSEDPKVNEFNAQRIFQGVETARELKAKHIVFHGNFKPVSFHDHSKLNWIERSTIFWSELLEKYPSTVVVLENTLDRTPEMLRTLLDEVNSPRLGVCLDVGHMNLSSKVPVEEWIAVLGKDIRSIHVHDNKGDFDSHSAIGKGTINWQEFSGLIAKYQIDPDIVFEVRTVEETIQSLKYLSRGKYLSL